MTASSAPAPGTFFTTSLVALRGYGLTRATALDQARQPHQRRWPALLLFALGGHMLWLLGAVHGGRARWLGGWIGSHSALRFGARLIRPLLVTTSLALTAQAAVELFRAAEGATGSRSP